MTITGIDSDGRRKRRRIECLRSPVSGVTGGSADFRRASCDVFPSGARLNGIPAAAEERAGKFFEKRIFL